MTIGKIKKKIYLKQGENRNDRFDTLLIYENNELEPGYYYNATLETAGGTTFNCIYYVEAQDPSE